MIVLLDGQANFRKIADIQIINWNIRKRICKEKNNNQEWWLFILKDDINLGEEKRV